MSGRLRLVGRAPALRDARAVLERGEPALMLVRGEVGSGKTLFLQVLRDEAAERGWAVAGPGVVDGVTLDHVVGPARFLELLERALVEHAPSLDQSAAVPLAHSRRGADAVTRRDPQAWRARQVLGALKRPALLLLDGFGVTERFAAWFQAEFLAEVRAARMPLVITVAEQAERLASLAPVADRIIEFGPPEADEIRGFLIEQAGDVQPGLSPDELERYVAGLQRNPDLLEPLARVLSLTRADA